MADNIKLTDTNYSEGDAEINNKKETINTIKKHLSNTGKENINKDGIYDDIPYTVLQIKEYEKYNSSNLAKFVFGQARASSIKAIGFRWDTRYKKLIYKYMYQSKKFSNDSLYSNEHTSQNGMDRLFQPVNLTSLTDWCLIVEGFVENFVQNYESTLDFLYKTKDIVYNYIYKDIENDAVENVLNVPMLAYIWTSDNDAFYQRDKKNKQFLGILHFITKEERIDIIKKTTRAKKTGMNYILHDLLYLDYTEKKGLYQKKVRTKLYLNNFLWNDAGNFARKEALLDLYLNKHLYAEKIKDGCSDRPVFTISQNQSDANVNLQGNLGTAISEIASEFTNTVATVTGRSTINVPPTFKLDRFNSDNVNNKEIPSYFAKEEAREQGIPVILSQGLPPTGLGTTGQGDIVNLYINVIKECKILYDVLFIKIIQIVTDNPSYVANEEDFIEIEEAVNILENLKK